VVLDQAVALPYQIELLGSLLSTIDATGYVLRSQLYPVYLSDAVGLWLEAPATGSYTPYVIEYPQQMDLIGALLNPPASGTYNPLVLINDLGMDAAGQANFTSPDTGFYEYVPRVLLIEYNASDVAGQAGMFAPLNGAYALVVIVVDTKSLPGYVSPDLAGAATLSAPTNGVYELG